MNWKEFLKPEWGKIVIFVILMAVTYFYESNWWILGPDVHFHGLPLPYYQCTTEYLPHTPVDTYCNFKVGPDAFPYIWLVIDVIFWYFISCLIVWIYDKVKKNECIQSIRYSRNLSERNK